MEVKDLGLQVLLRESGRMTIGRAPDLESGLEAFKAFPLPGPLGAHGQVLARCVQGCAVWW